MKATIGTWAHRPLPADQVASLSGWELKRWTLDLAYRPGLEKLEDVEALGRPMEGS